METKFGSKPPSRLCADSKGPCTQLALTKDEMLGDDAVELQFLDFVPSRQSIFAIDGKFIPRINGLFWMKSTLVAPNGNT